MAWEDNADFVPQSDEACRTGPEQWQEIKQYFVLRQDRLVQTHPFYLFYTQPSDKASFVLTPV